jgi:hypothetical protein
VCLTALEEATNSIIIVVILGVALGAVALALCVQAGKAKAAHREEVRYTQVSSSSPPPPPLNPLLTALEAVVKALLSSCACESST